MSKIHSVKLHLPHSKLENLEMGKIVQLSHNDLLGQSNDSMEITLHLPKTQLTKINKALSLNKGLRLDGSTIKIEHEGFEGQGFQKDARKWFKKNGKTIGKTVAQIGLPVASEMAGMTIGAYTGNPLLGEVAKSSVNVAGQKGINQIGGSISKDLKKFGKTLKKIGHSNEMKAVRRGLKSTYNTMAPIIADSVANQVYEQTGNENLANIAYHTTNNAGHGSIKQNLGNASRHLLEHGAKSMYDNGNEIGAEAMYHMGNHMLENQGYGLKYATLHNGIGYNGKLYLNGNPLLADRASNEPIQNKQFIDGKLSTGKGINSKRLKQIVSGSFISPGPNFKGGSFR